jgi:hypothetical protein
VRLSPSTLFLFNYELVRLSSLRYIKSYSTHVPAVHTRSTALFSARMESFSNAESVVLAMHAHDDFGRPDVVTSFSELRTAFPTASNDAVLDPVHAACLARQTVAHRSVDLWRRRDVTITKAAAFLMCLNPGVPPPDAEPRAASLSREECWIDPTLLPPARALEVISKAIQAQYEKYVSYGGRPCPQSFIHPALRPPPPPLLP